jgi:hypothetical protein
VFQKYQAALEILFNDAGCVSKLFAGAQIGRELKKVFLCFDLGLTEQKRAVLLMYWDYWREKESKNFLTGGPETLGA